MISVINGLFSTFENDTDVKALWQNVNFAKTNLQLLRNSRDIRKCEALHSGS